MAATSWLDAIGDGTIGKDMLVDKLKEASQRKSALEEEISRMSIIEKADNISSALIETVIEKKKDQLFSGNELEKKLIFQEFVNKVTVTFIPEEDRYSIDLTVRLFNGVENGT